jgi:hypothetical protein
MWRRLLGGHCLAIAMMVGATSSIAQTRPEVGAPTSPPASVLYVGNSFFYYNNSMHGHVNQLMRGAGISAPFRSTSITISGSGLAWHDIGSYFRPGAVASYSFNAANDIVMNPPGARLFDMAIMMDCSVCPIHAQLGGEFPATARRAAEIARSHGAEPVFFMSWANKNRPDMLNGLAEAYTRAGNENRALVIPAGIAFARAMAARPELDLYVPDLRHPSLAGTYLAAATTFAAIFGRSPEGNRYDAGLDAETAAFLQRTAWQTVQEYLGAQGTRN